MKTGRPKSGRQEQAEQTKTTILLAASREFSRHGFDGASTAAIMEAAGVNASLLYYYFEDKRGLYKAVFQSAIREISQRGTAITSISCSAGERLLRSALAHFDRFITHGPIQALFQQEMLRSRGVDQELILAMEEGLLRPWIALVLEMISEGIKAGELRQMDGLEAFTSILGANAYYFMLAPVFGWTFNVDPLSREALARKREGIIRFWGAIFFVDAVHGAEVAGRVLAEMPMPESTSSSTGDSR